jgi:hypothetical protein
MKKIIVFIKETFLLIFLISFNLLPFFSFNNYVRFFTLITIVIFIIKYHRNGSNILFLRLLFFIVFTFTINFFSSSSDFSNRHIQLYIFLILIYLSSIIYNMNLRLKNKLIFIILILNLFTTIISIKNLLLDSNVSRIIAKNSEEAEVLIDQGIGGYGFIYFNVISLPLFFLILKLKRDNFFLIIAKINIFSSITLVLLANYFIAIIMLILTLFILFYYSSKKLQYRVLKFFLFLIILISIPSNLDKLDNFTSNLVEGTNLQFKQQDVFNKLQGKESDNGTIEGRSDRYYRSIYLFSKNPILGTFSFDSIGKHSNILDQFAQYGIFLGLLLINIILFLPLIIIKSIVNQYKYYVYCFLFLVLILGFLNNYSMQIGVAMILLVCLFESNINNNNEKINLVSK